MDLRPAFENRSKVEQFQQKHRVSLLTLLFTDLVGSTKLKQDLGDSQALTLLQRHHQLIRDILSQFPEGEEISTAGDSFFIVFAKPSDAVHFSLRVQAGARRLSQTAPMPLLDRIGIHIGEVTIEQDSTLPKTKDLYGLQVDICARVMSLAGGDQILLTRSAFDNARQVLKGQDIEDIGPLDWLNHGPYLLKGIDDPMEICEAGERNRAVLKAPPDSEKVHRFSPPASEPVLGWRPAVAQPVPGTSWILERKLGEGGFGEVWLAAHKNLRERRVFKFCFRADRVRSLKRELTLLRLLKERFGDHQHIVKLHDVFLDEPPFYLAMEFVQGGDLPSWTAAQGGFQNVPLEMRLEIVAQVADAIQAAHDAGVIHRDIKPSNILVASSSPTIKLTDFGIGQVVSEELRAGMTQADFTNTAFDPGAKTTAGTHHYMAPELFAGGSASVASDIYSLGVLLFQVLTGDLSRPITTDWSREIQDPLLRDDLAKCTAHNPKERFATPGEVAKNLRSFTQRQIAKELEQAHELFESDDAAGALKRLAQVLRQDPSNRFAAERTVFALSQRNFVWPESEPLMHDDDVRWAEFSGDGKEIRSLAGRKIVIWNIQSRERLRQLPFERSISYLKFSSDGLKVLVAFSDNTLQIWNALTGELLVPALQANQQIHSAAFSPDGQKVITTHHGDTARIWNALTGEPLTKPLKHRELTGIRVEGGIVNLAEFRHDGKQVLTHFIGANPHLWDVETGQRLRLDFKSPQNLPLNLRFARFSPDGRRLLTVTFDGIQVWDLHRGELKSISLKPKGKIDTSIEIPNSPLPHFSPDGNRILAVSNDHEAQVSAWQIWDVWTGELLVEKIQPTANGFAHAQFTTNGAAVLTQPCRLWNSHDGNPLTEPSRFWKSFSPVGDRALTVRGKMVQVWEFRPSAPIAFPISSLNRARIANLSSDGQKLITAYADYAQVWDMSSGQPLTPKLQHSGLVTSAGFSSDGRQAVTGSKDKTARLWDARTGQHLSVPFEHNAEVLSAILSSDGKYVVTTANDRTVRVWNVRTAIAVAIPVKNGISPVWASPTPDSRFVLTTALDRLDSQFALDGQPMPPDPEAKLIRIWDIHTGVERTKPLQHDSPIAAFHSGHAIIPCSIEFSSDGSQLLSSTWNELYLWEFADGMATGEFRTKTIGNGGGRRAKFSSDGANIVELSNGGLQLWSSKTLTCLPALRHLPNSIQTARFSPDGQHAIITYTIGSFYDQIGCVRIWDLGTGLPVTEPFLEIGSSPGDAFFSSSGKHLISVLPSNGARVWEIPMPTLPVPHWFPELAESVAELGLEVEIESASSRTNAFLRLKQQINESVGADFYSRWAQWLLQKSETRTISPSTSMTVHQYAEREFATNSLDRARTAVMLSPHSGRTLARLAGSILHGFPPPGQRQLEEALWHSGRAVQLAPYLPEAWLTRAEALESTNQLPEALESINRAIAINPDQLAFWRRKISILEKCGQLAEGCAACTKAIELLPKRAGEYASHFLRKDYLMQRSRLLHRLGRELEALADRLSAFNIPPRAPSTPPKLIDLSSYYNDGFEDFYGPAQGTVQSRFKQGLHTFSQINFDVRGVVRCWGDNTNETDQRIVSIQTHFKCQSIHFLYGSTNLHSAESESEIARFVVRFENGLEESVPIVVGLDLGDAEQHPHLSNRVFIVPFQASGDDGLLMEINEPVFLKTWKNSTSHLAVHQIDFVATLDAVADPLPFLVAITAV